jgi:transglutaminase-like putative cysteine protease
MRRLAPVAIVVFTALLTLPALAPARAQAPARARAQAPAQAPAAAAEGNRLTVTLRYTLEMKPGTKRVVFTAVVPRTIPGRQDVRDIRYATPPRVVFDERTNRYAQWVLEEPGKTVDLSIEADVVLYRYDFDTARAQARYRDFEDPVEVAEWLGDEKYLESSGEAVREAARALVGKDEEETARKTMEFVAKTLKRTGYDPADNGAAKVLEKKCGDCTDFADLFIALCRANGLPARFREGFVTDAAPAEVLAKLNDTAKHDWAEVYLKAYGWVPFDPIRVNNGAATFERLRPAYLYLDGLRSNPVLSNFHYWAYRSQGDGPKVNESFLVKRPSTPPGR